MTPPRTRGTTRGVTLIEAVIALAVMSIGILALAGVQSTLRMNNDVARQRVDAVRIATQDLEQLRFFDALRAASSATGTGWDSITSAGPVDYAPPDGTFYNATYRFERRVTASTAASGPLSKIVETEVTWQNRAGATESVKLNTIVAAIEPKVQSVLLAAPYWPGLGFARRDGRALSIPVPAVPLQDSGTSGFKVPGASGVVWVFNNTTGYVTSVCTGVTASQLEITGTQLGNCTAIDGRLVSGTVQFDLRTGITLDAGVAASPTGPALPLDASRPVQFNLTPVPVNTSGDSPVCYADSPQSPAEAATRRSVDYFCLVKAGSDTTPGWGGKLDVTPATTYAGTGDAGWAVGSTAGTYKVCRYTRYVATAAQRDKVPNNDHPRYYCLVSGAGTGFVASICNGNRVTENLTNQNFLVIASVNGSGTANSCPEDPSTVSASAGVLVNYNTRQHQP